jgi:hypothetical protein
MNRIESLTPLLFDRSTKGYPLSELQCSLGYFFCNLQKIN